MLPDRDDGVAPPRRQLERAALRRHDNWVLLGVCLAVGLIILGVLYFAGALRPSTG